VQDYDAIVIGSGSGGLVAALALARSGARVIVFEQHHLPGGYSQTFSLGGFSPIGERLEFSFSPGVHYLGQLGAGGSLRRIYEGLGVANDLVFLEIDPDGYDRVQIDDQRFDIPSGRRRFINRLKARFPAETSGIDGYMEVITRMMREMQWANAPRGFRSIRDFREMLRMPLRMPTILRYGMIPLARLLDRFTHDPLLRAILSIQAGNYGVAPSRAPAIAQACIQDYYFEGAYYPRGGGHAIPDALIGQIRAHHGEVVLGIGVERILIEGGHAIGVRLADGREVRAAIVVSNADPGVTWGKLVEPQHVGARLRRRVARLRYSVSTLSLFLGVDMDLRAAGFDSGNVWYSRTPDIEAAFELAKRTDLANIEEFPALFFNISTLKDPSLRSDGLHTVEAMVMVSARAFDRWRNSWPKERPYDYLRLKERLADTILATLERFVPGLRERVVFRSLGTPLTNMHFVGTSEGSIYGTEKILRNVGPFGFPVRTHVPGLYQCGASVFTAGINGVSESGLAVAAAALGCEPYELLTATGQSLAIYPAENPAAWPVGLRPKPRLRAV
jgi:all-trans-retinol 13,14-reductase